MECFCFVVKENGKVRELGFGNWPGTVKFLF